MEDLHCSRCGKCCHYIIDGKLSKIPCKYLRRGKDGKTWCAIYARRIGTQIGNGQVCRYRKDTPWDYPGCTMNTDKPVIQEEI